MGFGALAFGVAIGALLAVAFVVAHGRVGSIRPRTAAMLIAAAGFAALYAVPMVKYRPTRPRWVVRRPSAHARLVSADGGPIGRAGDRQRLAGTPAHRRLGSWNATLVGAGAYLAGIAVAMWLLPAVDETPAGFAADDLYAFRLTALGTQLVLWATIAVVFARLADRLLDRTPRQGCCGATSAPTPA